jgi:uncharacterized protein YbjT (DUF2867 family)
VNSNRLLIAGATGSVGRRLSRLALSGDWWVRTFSRRAVDSRGDDAKLGDALRVGDLRGVCDGMDVVVSCIGASVALGSAEKRSYLEVDVAANRNLIAEAERAGVRRFIYLAAHLGDGYRDTAYIRAHEQVVDTLRSSTALSSVTVLRPTGIYTALDDLVKMARAGFGTVIGSGAAKTNPIHPEDVARACLEHLREGPPEIDLGGPEILTRRQIAETAFAAVGRKSRIASVPPAMMRGSARMLGLFNPRKAELLTFAASVTTADCVAPRVGTLRLADYFRELAGKSLRR